MHIPENKIEEIRNNVNIVDVVSEHVALKKRGKNFLGLCPFHNEKTPSFTVNEEKQIYYCFGCHNGGNVFKFMMDYSKISFVEAVQELADQLGIEIVAESSYDFHSRENQPEQEILYDINTEAAKYFSNNLLNSPGGETAREYFSGRKIRPQTMRIFGLGYAPPGWENFVQYAVNKKIDIDKCLQLGLIGKNAEGRLYDKFSGRIIFPVFSPNGRVIAFAGRVFQEKEGSAKYLNSPESKIYIKGKVLYGLSHAKDEIRKLDKAILVEGYMDLISLYQAGIKNVVAVSGTALTEDQVQLLSRYTKNIVLLFDADTAGIKASMRSIELLLKKDMEIRIASLPPGEDPDSYVNNYGKDKFEELISYASNFFEYQTAHFESLGMFEDPARTAEAVRELVKPAALIRDELKRTLLIKSIAKKFNLRENLLESELDKFLSVQLSTTSNDPKTGSSRDIQKELLEKETTTEKIKPEIFENEKDIIRLLFEGDKEIIGFISSNIEKDEFAVDAHRRLAALVYQSNINKEDILAGSLVEKISDEKLQAYVYETAFEKYSISKIWEENYPSGKERTIIKYSVDAVKKFKILKIDQQVAVNNRLIEKAETEDERKRLVLSNMELEREKKRIREIEFLESGKDTN